MAEALYITPLPRSRWRVCGRCGGTGERELPEDCHRSGGIVPCDCGNGWISTETTTRDEYERRRLAGELADSRGNLIPPPTPVNSWKAPVVS